MAYLGLVPSECSLGGSQRRGAITKAGNSHARRMLVEAAWHYRHRPTVGRALGHRTADQPPHIVGQAWRARIGATAICSGTANARRLLSWR
jgi:transposase